MEEDSKTPASPAGSATPTQDEPASPDEAPASPDEAPASPDGGPARPDGGPASPAGGGTPALAEPASPDSSKAATPTQDEGMIFGYDDRVMVIVCTMLAKVLKLIWC